MPRDRRERILDRQPHRECQHERRFSHSLAVPDRHADSAHPPAMQHGDPPERPPPSGSCTYRANASSSCPRASQSTLLGRAPPHPLHEPAFDLSPVDGRIQRIPDIVEDVHPLDAYARPSADRRSLRSPPCRRQSSRNGVPSAGFTVPADPRRAEEPGRTQTHALQIEPCCTAATKGIVRSGCTLSRNASMRENDVRVQASVPPWVPARASPQAPPPCAL